MRILNIVACFLALCLPANSTAQHRVFSIGNSLTADMLPTVLDDTQYQIFCGKNLNFILTNPDGHCVNSSTRWSAALTNNQYHYVTVQPFQGTVLNEDIAIIAYWMTLQPEANFIIHSGWSPSETFPTDYAAGNSDNQMRPSPEYIQGIFDGLKVSFPNRTVVQTHANDLLYTIWLDIQRNNKRGEATREFLIPPPFDDFTQLYRDSIHLDHSTGRYLVHQALRYAIRLPIFQRDGFDDLTDEQAEYLDQKIMQVLVIPGDINRDRKVNLLDVAPFVEIIANGEYDITADMNNNGQVELLDISLFIDAVLEL
jgi:hypothetical protein